MLVIRIANDYYTAYLSYDPESQPLSAEEMIQALEDKNVTFGVDRDAVEQLASNGLPAFDVPVARGIPHVNGTDASVVFSQRVDGEKRPEVQEDGTVDFKNIGYLTMVKKGTVIARKTPATQGTSGMTVTGKTIHPKPGRDKLFRPGKNVSLSKDGLEMIAEIDGKLSVTDGRANVLSVVEIRGDVGIETGNIDFIGNIVVNGDVNAGYTVRTDGDIVVNGFVGGATMIATGSITVSRGIQGQNGAYVECGGNLVSNFINDCKLKVGGNLEANIIMNSDVRCDGTVTLKGKKGQLIGGEIVCRGDLEAKVIGSELEIITSIKLGIDPEAVDELREITAEIRTLTDESEQVSKELKTLAAKLQGRDDMRLLSLLAKYRARQQEIEHDLPLKQNRRRLLQTLVNNMLGSRLKAGELYPGTRIRIGNGNYYVKFRMLNTIVMRDQGEIKTIGY